MVSDMDDGTLGTTGTKVTPLCLGAMMFGQIVNADHDASIRIIHRALDAGINFIDTADVYSRGESEAIVGKALAGGGRVAVGSLSQGRRAADVTLSDDVLDRIDAIVPPGITCRDAPWSVREPIGAGVVDGVGAITRSDLGDEMVDVAFI